MKGKVILNGGYAISLLNFWDYLFVYNGFFGNQTF